MGESTPNGRPGGLWALIVLSSIATMLAGTAAIVQPIRQQIEGLARQIEQHSKLPGHTEALERHASASERFKEVETQFDALRDVSRKSEERHHARLTKLEDWQKWWYQNIHRDNALHSGRIEALEHATNRITKLFEIRSNNIRKLIGAP